MFTIQGCSPKRGEICSCTHVPEIQCTHIKIISFLLKRTRQVAEPFSTRVFSFYILWFYFFIQVYSTCISHSLPFLVPVFDVVLLRLCYFLHENVLYSLFCSHHGVVSKGCVSCERLQHFQCPHNLLWCWHRRHQFDPSSTVIQSLDILVPWQFSSGVTRDLLGSAR